TVWKCN
ncbi:efflux transporter, RND family, MFP subunit, partial [Vibrio parahaemolyticus AQ3810]